MDPGGASIAATPPLLAQEIRLEGTARATSSQLHDLAMVADAAMDGQGRVFILDPSLPRVIVTDSQLRSLGYFGRRGSGLGEFRDPVSIGILADGRIAVLDRALGRITLFQVRDGGAEVRPQETIQVGFLADAMCVLPGGRFLLHGFVAGSRLHVIGADGQRLRSFAPVAADRSHMAQTLLSRGRITCDTARDEVLVSSRFLPAVESYRISTGQRTWEGRLEPFRAITIEDQGSQVSISSGSSGASLVTSQLATRDHFVVQAVFDARTDGATADTVTTYVYSRHRREWLPHGYRAPLMFGVADGMALTVRGRDELEMTILLNRVITPGGGGRREQERRR